MSIVALLPMKLHSARVPGKNFRNFAGKPLYRWTLDHLLALDEIDKIVINTDARPKLEETGLRSGGRIVIRDRIPALCGDEVSMNRIIEDDISAVDAETYLMTHTTNPLLTPVTFRAALDVYRAELGKGKDSLFSVNRFQTRFYDSEVRPVNHDPENLVPTQELQPWYEENSCLYIFNRESFALTRARIGRHPALFETPRLESADIDNTSEWYQAEIAALSRLMFESHSGLIG
jgi:CMP-N-acetylneuraminic acid synthetase